MAVNMNAPIKYFGGKGQMFNKIIEHFPDSSTYDTYIEPFGGSFSIGLKKPNETPIEIYNDLEKNVYSLYKVLSDKELFEQFKIKCDLSYYIADLRNEYRDKLKSDDLFLLDRAFYFFYVNRTSHNGIGGLSVNTVVRRNMCKSVSDMLSCIDRLPELHQRLSKCIFLNQDGINLIEKYNKENVFIYSDPPYEWSTRTSVRYKVDMDREGHLKFIDACLNSKAKILISGYDCEIYDALTDANFTKIKFEVNTIGGNMKPKTKVETLWKNY
nr:MAG: D12 class N6 adenine-specific DNA methyltransferase [Bacteriophage sp.]